MKIPVHMIIVDVRLFNNMKLSQYRIFSKKKDSSFFSKIKFRRILVLWRKWRKSLDKTITMDDQKLSTYQEKAIRLWRLCLKDNNTKMAYNTLGIRHIEKGNLFITYTPADNNSYVMTIMDINDDRKNLFEIHIPSKHAGYAIDLFDIEMKKRMMKVDNTKRAIIESDIDKLLSEEEKSLAIKYRGRNK